MIAIALLHLSKGSNLLVSRISAILTTEGSDDDHSLLSSSPEVSRRDAWSTASAAAAVTSSGLLLLSPYSTANAADTTTKVPTVTLGKGTLQVTRTIQGQWQLAGGHGRYRESEALDNIQVKSSGIKVSKPRVVVKIIFVWIQTTTSIR
jgi:hypothetical protein